MEKQKNETVEIEHRFQDALAFVVTGDGTYLRTNITKAEITRFCNGCDNLQGDGVCRFGARDQARYAARQEGCGWASVKGVRGQMTAEGFKA